MTDLTSDDGIETKPNAIYLKDYQVPDYLIDELNLEFRLDAANTVVSNVMQMRRNKDVNPDQSLVLEGQHLALVSVELDGKALSQNDYVVTAESLTINKVPEEFTLAVTTKIEPEKNTALEGLYASSGMLCTQCEAEGFRRITYFLSLIHI